MTTPALTRSWSSIRVSCASPPSSAWSRRSSPSTASREDLVALHVEALCLAILTRLLSMRGHSDLPATGRRMAPLPKWRLKRVVDYVNAHLASRITLADLASAAGRTRMHFAAQFRVATGSRPHDFVLRRQIERAQQLLRDPSLALADIALSVGFQNQAHFTTVFKRFTGATPHRWRRSTQVSGFRDGSQAPAATRPSASAVEAVASRATAQASS